MRTRLWARDWSLCAVKGLAQTVASKPACRKTMARAGPGCRWTTPSAACACLQRRTIVEASAGLEQEVAGQLAVSSVCFRPHVQDQDRFCWTDAPQLDPIQPLMHGPLSSQCGSVRMALMRNLAFKAYGFKGLRS